MFHVEHSEKHIETCPVCSSNSLTKSHASKDHTVSKKGFQVLRCPDCTLKITSPRPEDNQLGEYYKSEEYVSHTSSKKGLINAVYHHVRTYTLGRKLSLIQSINNPKSILDYGCGTGDFLKRCADSGIRVRGVEPDEGARKLALSKLSGSVSDLDQIYAEKDQYDIISLWHVLEHVADLNTVLERLISKLSTNGHLIVAVPNPDSTDATYYKEEWAAWDVPRHLWHFSPQSFISLMAKHNMDVVTIKPMWFDSFYVSMLSEKNSGGSIVRAFFIGLYSNFKALWSKKPICSSQIYIARPKLAK